MAYDEFSFDLPDSALTDFTLMLDLSLCSASWWAAVDTTDGTKGRAYKRDGTRLAIDWIDFDDSGETGFARILWSGTQPTSGTIRVRVEPPQAANASEAASGTYGRHNAYASHWEGFYPLTDLNDRTANGHDLTASGSPTSGATGKIGDCYDFDSGSSQYLRHTMSSPITSDDWTLLSWADVDGAGNGDTLINVGDADGQGGVRINKASSDINAETQNHLSDSDATISYAATTGFVFAGMVSNAGAPAAVFNGSVGTAGAARTGIAALSELTVGARYRDGSDGFHWEGLLDEAQVHSTALSAAWIKHEYDQTNDPATFWGSPTWYEGAYDLLANDAIARWDARAITADDSTIYGYDFSWTGNESYAPGPHLDANAFDLDGSSYVSGTGFSITSDYAVLFRIKCDDTQTATHGGIFEWGSIEWFISQSTGRLWGRHDGNGVADSSDGPLIEGQGWVSIGIDYNSSTGDARLFVDGVLAETLSSQVDDSVTADSLFEQSGNELLGQVADFRVYNRSLTPTEHATFAAGPGGTDIQCLDVQTDSWVSDNTNVGTLDFTLTETPNDGDLLLMVAACGANTDWTVTTPTGWTEEIAEESETGSNHRSVQVFYRVADSDGTSYSFENENQFMSSVGKFYRLANVADPLDYVVSSFTYGSDYSDVVSPGVTVTANGSLLLRVLLDARAAAVANGPPVGLVRSSIPPEANAAGTLIVDIGPADSGATGAESYSFTPTWHDDFKSITLALSPAEGEEPPATPKRILMCLLGVG